MGYEARQLHVFFYPLMAHGHIILGFFPAVEAGLHGGCKNTNSVPSEDLFGTFFMAVDAARKYGISRLVFHGTSCFSECVTANIKRYASHQKVTPNSEIFVVPGLPDQIEMTKSKLPIRADSNDPLAEIKEKRTESEVKSFGILMNRFYELESAYTEYYTKEIGLRITQLMGNGEEAEDMRKRARELGEKAKKAVEKGGSSYSDLTAVIEELRLHSQPST
ncbi:hypothetical protein IFM89_005812 [Coptis chinensis]|uniref:Uncharacterized protein n=1 Tax=Coptis chinensis TaxID=261450 RepID=A0A835IPD0_9MAGN|nr:hypothetical protein IFM89_005812 [Coptis chinensis]